MAYDEIIQSAAKQYQIDPDLIRAIISVESNWDPNAYRAEPQISDASYGLMQLLLSTAKSVSGNSSLTPNQLIDPTLNISLGSQYLRQLYNRFGNLMDVVASYNAGSPIKSGDQYMNQKYIDKVKLAYTYYQYKYIGIAGVVLIGGITFYLMKR